ncbi:MAG TPA: hypothetical protein QF753_18355 [Victivallales bacterium]|nr:hypothetical protein [Victivallales bacterium]
MKKAKFISIIVLIVIIAILILSNINSAVNFKIIGFTVAEVSTALLLIITAIIGFIIGIIVQYYFTRKKK